MASASISMDLQKAWLVEPHGKQKCKDDQRCIEHGFHWTFLKMYIHRFHRSLLQCGATMCEWLHLNHFDEMALRQGDPSSISSRWQACNCHKHLRLTSAYLCVEKFNFRTF